MEIIKRDHFRVIEEPMEAAGLPSDRVMAEISYALQTINKTPKLRPPGCSEDSLRQAVLNVANIGLSLNPAAKLAYLIPRWNKVLKCNEAVLEPSYIGLVKLLTDSGSVTAILAQIVYEKDFFELDLADTVKPVTHKPVLKQDERGGILGVYALATLPGGIKQAEWMDVDKIVEIRDRSETYKAYKEGAIKSCTWITDFEEMTRKTVIRRIYKYLPRTDRMEKIDKAIELDESDYKATDDQLNYIENLLHTSTLDEREVKFLEMELPVMNPTRASEVIEMLKNNQQDMNHRLGSQKETSAHIRNISGDNRIKNPI